MTDKREKIIAHVSKNFPGKLGIYSYKTHFGRSVEEMLEKGYLSEGEEIENYKKCYKGFLRERKSFCRLSCL